MANERLKIGEGKISGYLSIFLAILCLGGTICAYFPEYLTTVDFREIYKPNYIKWAFLAVLTLSFGFALTSFILSKKTKLGFLATIIIAASIFLASGLPEYKGIDSKVSFSLLMFFNNFHHFRGFKNASFAKDATRLSL